MLRNSIFFLAVVLSFDLFSQFSDNFSDGDFSNSPSWNGQSKFTISSGVLRLNDIAAGTAFLSTTSQSIHNATWEFYVQLDFNTSSSNYTKVYLISDQSNLSGNLNGYYVAIGGTTTDEVSLYKQTGVSTTKIIDGVDNAINFTTVKVKVRVTRDGAGNWSLEIDTSSTGPTGSYVSQGNVADVTYTTSTSFGIHCIYTITRATAFWFDDFVVTGTPTPDLNPPTISSTQVLDESHIKISFNEAIESSSATNAVNYSVSNGIGNPSIATLEADNKTVILNLTTPLTNGLNYSVQVSGVKDLDGNTIVPISKDFLYLLPQPVNKDDIIITEFMADPTPVVGLPESEFIEIFNRSPNPINLLNWIVTDGSSAATLPNHILMPNNYLVLTSVSNSSLYTASVGVASFPSLNNSGDNIVIRNSNGLTIDSIHYDLQWYHSDEKKDGGWSIEIIDPENLCGEKENWTASNSSTGGTPGSVNSVKASNPDVTPPYIISTKIVNPSTIEILFDEKMDVNEVIAQANPSVNFLSANYSNNLRSLTIHFSSPFQFSTPYQITLSNIKDCSGNALAINKFQFVLPEAAQPGDLFINEILFNPKVGGADFVEVYNNSSKHISLKKSSLANYDGSSLTNSKSINETIINPKEYKIFTSDTAVLRSHYPKAKISNSQIISLPAMSDDKGSIALVDSLGNVLDYLQYTESMHSLTSNQEGVALERIDYSSTINDSNNWKSAAQSEGWATPGYKNSAYYPFLISTEIKNANSIALTFNKPLDPISGSAKSNYSLLGGGNPNEVLLQNNNKTILLVYSSDFKNGQNYKLSVIGLKDPEGNTLLPFEVEILYFLPTRVHSKDVIISEFMADPTPAIGLPETEYVELYNRSNNPFNLLGWTLTDGSATAQLPQYILLPSSRCVITTNSGSLLLSGSIGLSNFPSLNNSGDQIVIRNNSGVVIDSISYSDKWYHSDDKKDGGWSLEIVDAENLCEEEGNWTASEDVKGGTPGMINSVNASNPDITNPEVISSVIKDSNTIEITFNEKMSASTNYSAALTPSITINSIQFDPLLRKLLIKTTAILEKSVFYKVSLSNIYDCSGNALINSAIDLIIPEEAKAGDIVINEILFNPKSGGVDFVEVYNKTDKHIGLQNWSLSNIDNDAISNSKPINIDNLIIKPNSFHVFTTDQSILKAHYPRAVENVISNTSLPSLSDDEGSIAIVNQSGTVIDYLVYNDQYHSPFLKDVEGVSLERISIESETNNSNNWHSASQMENFATPGYKNSASQLESSVALGEVSINPEIFSPQNPPNDYTTILYQFEQAGQVANVSIYDAQGRIIKKLANNEVLGVEGFYRWDGDRDDGGLARAGYYVALMEVFDNAGNVTSFRKRVVIAYR